MGRSALLVFISLSVLTGRVLAVESIDANPALSTNDALAQWDIRPWTGRWARADIAELPSLSASVPSVPVIYQQNAYAMVPLPPAVIGTGSLAALWLTMRGIRVLRRSRPGRII